MAAEALLVVGAAEISFRDTLDYGTNLLEYNVIRRPRKTLEIAVLPSGGIQVTAPLDASPEAIRAKVRKRAPWIVKQRSFFRKFLPRTPHRQYLGGETHLYLGRHYRLKILEGKITGVRLSGGFLEVTVPQERKNPETVRKEMETWYRRQAWRLFPEILAGLCARFGIASSSVPKLQIRKMKTRWGSFSCKGTLTLNDRLVQAPQECIVYVITHELCHLSHPDHGPEFYRLLLKRLPDWEKRKRCLELALV